MKQTFNEYFMESLQSKKEDDKIDTFIKGNGIKLDRGVVKTIIAITNKSLRDYNRDKDLDGNEIEKVVVAAIKDKIINII
jgi:hypothetical protein